MRYLMIFLLAVLCAGCGPSTRFAATWADKTYTGGPVSNVAVFVLATDPLTRRVAEDEVVRQLPPGTKSTSSYALYETLPADREVVAAALRERGFDAALVIQLVDVKKEEVYIPPTREYVDVPVYMNNGFGGFYGHAYQQVFTPGYTSTVTTAVVDSALYSLARAQPLWLGTTHTVDPGSSARGARSVAERVSREIRKQGLFAP